MANNKEKEVKTENNEEMKNLAVETNTEETIAQEETKDSKFKQTMKKVGRGAKKALPYVGAAVIGAVATFTGLAVAGRKAETDCADATPALDDPTFDPTIPVDVE